MCCSCVRPLYPYSTCFGWRLQRGLPYPLARARRMGKAAQASERGPGRGDNCHCNCHSKSKTVSRVRLARRHRESGRFAFPCQAEGIPAPATPRPYRKSRTEFDAHPYFPLSTGTSKLRKRRLFPARRNLPAGNGRIPRKLRRRRGRGRFHRKSYSVPRLRSESLRRTSPPQPSQRLRHCCSIESRSRSFALRRKPPQ